MISILEFEGREVKIGVPRHVEIISKIIDKWVQYPSFKHNDAFEEAYNYLQCYYEARARKIFGMKANLLEGFMKSEEDVLDYCKIIDFITD